MGMYADLRVVARVSPCLGALAVIPMNAQKRQALKALIGLVVALNFAWRPEPFVQGMWWTAFTIIGRSCNQRPKAVSYALGI